MREDAELVGKIEALSRSECQKVAKNSKGLLWQIKIKPSHQAIEQEESDSFGDFESKESSDNQEVDGEQEEKHIMISYNRDSRDLCLSVKSQHESMGHKIWIDVESIHGSSLESMAAAIENSACVLICITEKYKSSPNCRAEAEYAFQLGKPIVPLYMQANYKADGWY